MIKTANSLTLLFAETESPSSSTLTVTSSQLISFPTSQNVKGAPTGFVLKMAPSLPSLHFLRPYAFQSLVTGPASGCSAYLRFYDLARQNFCIPHQRNKSTKSKSSDPDAYNPEERSALMAFRIKELREADALSYPRLKRYGEPMTISRFKSEYDSQVGDTTKSLKDIVTIGGRIRSISRLGSKLFFLRLVMDGSTVQAILNMIKLIDGTEVEQLMQLSRLLQRGDHICKSCTV